MDRQEFSRILPKLANDYKPAPEVLRQINNVVLVMMIGPSAAGKNTLIKKTGLCEVLNYTTRDPRPKEKDGVDYIFLKDYRQTYEQIKKGEFVQMLAGINGDLYGTKASSYPQNGFASLPVLSDVVPQFRELGFKDTISIFVTPPSNEEWQRRLKSHRLTTEQLNKRLAEAKRSYEFALADEHTHLILNDDIKAATIQVHSLLSGEADTERETAARQAIEEILRHLE
jgi:guanylate kinase